jgi:hypothetical protein
MSSMHTLGVVAPNGTATVAMVQEEPNSARDADANVNMEVDKNSDEGITTDEEEGQLNDDELVDYNEDGTAAAAEG